MKISELRALIDDTSPDDLKQIILEIYRALPKKTRENLAIDQLVKNPTAAHATAKAKAGAHSVDIDALEWERAVQAGIKPRDSLAGAYNYLKIHGELHSKL
jgi:hypothetical protein